MREIKLNSNEYLRGNIVSATVDEGELQFINGVALAKAIVTAVHYGRKKVYECYGLIDEDFHEVYGDTKQVDFKAQRNLMFLGYNLCTSRFLDNDYIVKVSCGDDDRSWNEYRHIRIENGVPKTIKIIGEPIRTRVDRLVICNLSGGLCLYDISKGSIITPLLSSIKETDDGELFDVSIRIKLDGRKDRYELVDYLFFKIDSTGKIVSRVLSSLENGYLDVAPDVSVNELIKNRKQYLQEREIQLGEELSEFRKSIDTTTKGSTGHVIKMVAPNNNNQ